MTVGTFVLLGIEDDGAVTFRENIETSTVREIFGVLPASVQRDEERGAHTVPLGNVQPVVHELIDPPKGLGSFLPDARKHVVERDRIELEDERRERTDGDADPRQVAQRPDFPDVRQIDGNVHRANDLDVDIDRDRGS